MMYQDIVVFLFECALLGTFKRLETVYLKFLFLLCKKKEFSILGTNERGQLKVTLGLGKKLVNNNSAREHKIS
jgi:hypothetical protein